MKRLKDSRAAKLTAALLFCALCLAFIASAVCVSALYSSGFYSLGADAARSQLARSLCLSEGTRIAQRVYPSDQGYNHNDELCGSDSYRYVIYDSNGVERARYYSGEAALCFVTIPWSEWYTYDAIPEGSAWGEEDWSQAISGPVSIPAEDDAPPAAGIKERPQPTPEPAPESTPESTSESTSEPAPESTPSPAPQLTPRLASHGSISSPGDVYAVSVRSVDYTVVCYLLRDITQKDNAYIQLRCFDFAAGHGALLAAAAAGSFLLALILFIFLLSAAGHRRGEDGICESSADRIPFDLFTVLCIAAFFMLIGIFWWLFDSADYGAIGTVPIMLRLAAAAFLLCAMSLLGLLWCMSAAVRIKKRTLIRGTLCFMLLRLAVLAVKSIPLVWRGLLAYCAFAFLGLIVMAAYGRSAPAVWTLGCILVFPAVIWLLVCFRRLRDGARELAKGNLGYTVPGTMLVGELRRHAEDLNNIRAGMSRAVDERTRSERMKTELITNVSHDIKTPLTSIINYVDLLSKEELPEGKAREYVEVLQRQSARLKKLTDDLVEASKASSGALGVNIESCDLCVMLDQTAGEYGERLAGKGLELVVRKPEGPVTVLADVHHTQRIFDNLMNNILKYALSATRVYLDLAEGLDGAAVIFRNTSRSRIEQSAEELSERFVRGDRSRSSEGSGLGLSIAKSLAELQGGSLSITVDGDLFKAVLGFRKQ